MPDAHADGLFMNDIKYKLYQTRLLSFGLDCLEARLTNVTMEPI
jgi:hypothetical protein